jgi:hypothetical protein
MSIPDNSLLSPKRKTNLILDQLLSITLPVLPNPDTLSDQDKEKIRFGISRLEDKIYLFKKELGSYDLNYLLKETNLKEQLFKAGWYVKKAVD